MSNDLPQGARELRALLLDRADLDAAQLLVRELAAGDPVAAWGAVGLATSTLQISLGGSGFAAEQLGDDRVFTWSATSSATATQADGGWTVEGEFPGAVGAAHATHLVGRASVAGSEEGDDVIFAVPLENATLTDSTGFGLGAAAIRDITVDNVAVDSVGTATTSALVNDLWITTIRQVLLAAVVVGAASTEVDIFLGFADSPLDSRSPEPRKLDPDYQRLLGKVTARLLAGQLLLDEASLRYADVLSTADLGSAERVDSILHLRGLAYEGARIARSVDADVQRTATSGSAAAAQLRLLSEVMASAAVVAEGPADEWTVRALSTSRLGLPIEA